MTKNNEIRNQSLKIPKLILFIAKFSQAISMNLATRFAAKLFTTPIKHKIPKRELHMLQKSVLSNLYVSEIKKEIVVYRYGNAKKKILLVHGWSGRGTQLVKIADAMLEKGYEIISFDAPAHGKSKGRTTIMTEFIASIMELEKQFGPFEFAVGHSLGGMSVLNSIKRGLNVKKAVIIGSGDIIQDIIDDFIRKLKMKTKVGHLMRQKFERDFGEPMNNYSAYVVAKSVSTPILIIHDENDEDVPVKAAHNIDKHLQNSKLIITNNLGHRKILGNQEVITEINKFFTI